MIKEREEPLALPVQRSGVPMGQEMLHGKR